ADELTIHYGLVPRCNRGIFGINELPDLAERIQVGLLNIMEEKDVQIRGYRIRLPLDLLVVASANPEDYTSRGRIITPLKDRFGSQVRTHYPLTVAEEIEIMEGERAAPPSEIEVLVPGFMKEVVAEVSHGARRSPHISRHPRSRTWSVASRRAPCWRSASRCPPAPTCARSGSRPRSTTRSGAWDCPTSRRCGRP